jgi:chromosome segregation ATPase
MFVIAPVYAAEKKDKSAHRMAQMKQQLEAEKAQLQAQFEQDKTALEAKVQASEKESGEIKSNLASAKHRNASLTAELGSLRKEKVEAESLQHTTEASLHEAQASLDKVSKSLAELAAAHQIATRDLNSNEVQRKELSKSLAQRDSNLTACVGKNTKLHDFGVDLIKIYEKPSAYQAVLRTEPFSQIKRVELENILQDYNDKIDEQRVSSIQK